MTSRNLRRAVGVFLTAWLAVFAARARACDVPVFRYALECWPASPYEVVVLHRGSLLAAEQEIVERLRHSAGEKVAHPNFKVRLSHLAGQNDASTEQLWDEAGRPELPCMILRYPQDAGIERAAWSGRLTAENAAALLDSPARREIARRILNGDSAVWVLLESGDNKADAAARNLLETHLAHLERTLELSAAVGVALPQQTEAPETITPPLLLLFSIMALSRTSPNESVFIELLLHSEADLVQYASQPIAFPVFGQGRILYALVGSGISEENIGEACRFLVGPCSCEAKALNPGVDLLMLADWDAGLGGSVVAALEPQPLVGLATLAEAAATPEAATPTPEAASAVSGAARPATPEPPSALMRNMLVALGLIGVIIGFIILRITRHTPRDRP